MLAAVVILYNPKENYLEHIFLLRKLVKKCYLIDNSDNFNQNLNMICENNQDLMYIFNGKNIGVATSLNLAIKIAVEDKYKYLLTLDQDSFFENRSLEKLISKINDDNVAIYSPFHKNKYFTNPPKSKGIEEVTDVMTSGNILNLDVIKKIGNFKDDYFIDYVDIEFCLRVRRNGFKIIRVNDSILVHNEANLSKNILFGRTIYSPNHKAFRWYYKIRNYNYLKKEYKNYFPEYFKNESRNIIRNILKIILYENEKVQKFNMIIKGYIHFLKGIKGQLL